MAGLIKEILLDYGLNRLSIDQRSDISSAINELITAGVIKPKELQVLDMYIAGYTAKEIAEHYITTTDKIEAILTRLCQAIEYASGYTDSGLVKRVKTKDMYKLGELHSFLLKHGTKFFTHELS